MDLTVFENLKQRKKKGNRALPTQHTRKGRITSRSAPVKHFPISTTLSMNYYEQLRPVGMVVTLDAIFNRVIRNWRQGKRTWILADEFYILFRYSFSAEFFYRLFKRMRKYNAFITAVSQNVDEILRSDTARLMLANSELLVMLNQAATDREELAKLLNISENQLSYITNVPAGHGLIRCGGAIIPFENSFPKNTKLYRLMTTKPDEKF